MAFGKYRLSKKAVIDLNGIAGYLSERNAEAAKRVVGRLYDAFQDAANNPDIGTNRDDLRPGLRILSPPRPAHNYIILFYKADRGVEITGVLHGAQDWQGLIADDQR